MLSPSRRKIGCGSVRIIAYKSPAAPPCPPAFPLPGSRMRCPSRVPALMRTSSGSDFATMSSPWHVGHVVRFFPVPWHRGHCTLNFMRPPVCVICPVPLHSGHFPGASSDPCPWQVAQVSCREIFSFITPPRIAVQNGTLTWYSRSLPGSGPSFAGSPRPPPVTLFEKISRNPPPPAPLELLRPPGRAPSKRSEKSKPPKSTFVPAPGWRPPPGNPPPKPPSPGWPPPRA